MTKETDNLNMEKLVSITRIGLAKGGVPGSEQDRLAVHVATVFHETYRGRRPYFLKGRPQTGFSCEDRKRIFMEWDLNRDDAAIISKEKISFATLRKIKAEGRKKKWAIR